MSDSDTESRSQREFHSIGVQVEEDKRYHTDWAETCYSSYTEALGSWGLPELCTPPLPHSIFPLSPLAETELSNIPIPG